MKKTLQTSKPFRTLRNILSLCLVMVMTVCAAWGQEEIVYTLNGTTTGGSNGYATESSITQNNITWKVTANTTVNPWRFGGKSISNQDRPMYSTSTFTDNISKVVVTNGTATITVNSIRLIVSSNSDFSNPTSTLSGTWHASSTTTFEKPAGADWSNKYFKIVYYVTNTSSSNKYAEFKKAEFYKEAVATPSITASNVNIGYDATSGTIAYSITNPTTGTSLTANTTASWLTVGTVGDNDVSFTCTANTSTSARTATVTLTYGDVTKDVTVTQAGAPATYTVTFYAGNGTCGTTSITEVDGTIITLPTATPSTECANAGWTFAGWATSSIDETSTAPSLRNGSYTISSDATLYAVYTYGTGGGNSIYRKVTSEPTDWSGEYLIVYEDIEVAFDGSLTSLDVAENTIDIEINNNTIEATTTNHASSFIIEPIVAGTTYTIQSASGMYIGKTSGSNNGMDISSTEHYINSLSYDNDNGDVDISSSGGAHLRFNADATQARFRYYKSTGYEAQEAIQLYRLENGNAQYATSPSCLAERVATPTFSPEAGTYNAIQTVTISCETTGATIYYTTDGTMPTDESTEYTAAITVDETTTINAIAIKENMDNSFVATATYTINLPVTITFDAGSGTCTTTSESGLAGSSFDLPTATPSAECSDAGWTFAGWTTSPVEETQTAPTLLSGSYTINEEATLYAVYSAVDNSGMFNNYSYQKLTTQPSDFSGTYLFVHEMSNSVARVFNGMDASNGYETVAINNGTIEANENTNKLAISVVSYNDGYSLQINSASDNNPGKYICGKSGANALEFKTSPVANTASWVSGRVNFTSYEASFRYNATSGQDRFRFFKTSTTGDKYTYPVLYKYVATSSVVYATSPSCLDRVATPTFSPEGGDYAEAQSVEISCETEDATIYYTTDGTTPTTSSTQYTNAITISATTTLKAIAVKDGMSNSFVSTITYNFPITIAEAHALNTGNNAFVAGTVMATCTQGFVLGDATGFIYTYNTNHGRTIGERLTINGTLSEYGGFKQFTNTSTVTSIGTETPTYPTPVALDGAGMDAWAASPVIEYVTYTGVLSIDGNYYEVAVDGAEAIGSIVGPGDLVSSDMDGAEVTVTGFAMYKSGNTHNYINTVATSVAVNLASPQFLPVQGLYNEAQNVTISCETEDATIYYTTDGTTPSTSSTQYNGAITVNATTTIKAIAVKNNVQTHVAVATYHIMPLGEWVAVTSTDELQDGDLVVIGFDNKENNIQDRAMSVKQTSDYREAVSATIDNDKLSYNYQVQIFTLEKNNNQYAFFTGSGYIYAAGGESGNYLRTQETNNDRGIWTIGIVPTSGSYTNDDDELISYVDYVATIQSITNETESTIIRYSSGSPARFSCYKETSTVHTLANLYKYVTLCLTPTDLAAGTVTHNTAELSWTAGSTEEAWEVQYRPVTEPESNWTLVSDLTATAATLSNLNANTLYEAQVLAVCSQDKYSDWSESVNFTTDCAPITNLPWTEDFNDGIPTECWTMSSTGGSAEWIPASSTINDDGETFTSLENGAATNTLGNGTATLDPDAEFTTVSLITPKISLPAEGTARLKFKQFTAFTDETIYGQGQQNNVLIHYGNETVTMLIPASEFQWQEYTLLLEEDDYANETISIEFKQMIPSGYEYYWYIDDVTVEMVPECPKIAAGYTEDFEHFTTSTDKKTGVQPTCWTIFEVEGALVDTAKPQILYQDGRPHDGDYCLYMFGKCLLAMPELAEDVNVTSLKMELWLRQHKYVTQLQVGLVSDPTQPLETFTPLATLDNGSSTEAMRYVIDFGQYTGNDNPKLIAFRNILAPGIEQTRSVQFIDDIHLFLAGSSEDPTCGIEVEYEQDFETTNDPEFDCWTFIPDVQGAAAPKIVANNAQTGTKALYMSGRGIYAMPQITGVDNLSSLTMTFYVMQRKYAHRLAVGVLEDNGEFTEIDNIYNEGNYSSPVYHTVNFAGYTGDSKRIAFRNVAINTNAVSYNWIDDINIFETPDVTCGITAPYEQGFELTDDGVECWEFIPATENAVAPKVVASNANSGDYCLYMTGLGTYVLPEITNVEDLSSLTLTFSVRQRKYAHRVAVGVLEDPAEQDGEPVFVKIADIYNGGVYNEYVPYTFDLSSYTGSGKRIAFQNFAINTNSVSYNWIDDISISETGTRAVAQYNGNHFADAEDYDFNFNEGLDFATLGVDGFDISEFTVYPNPTSGMLTLGMEAQRVEMLSLTGQKVALFENASSIDISNLPSGVYILKATLPQGTAVRKVVKQ